MSLKRNIKVILWCFELYLKHKERKDKGLIENTLYIYAAVYDFALFQSSYTKRLYLWYLCISIYLPLFPHILISVYVYFDCFCIVPFQISLFVEPIWCYVLLWFNFCPFYMMTLVISKPQSNTFHKMRNFYIKEHYHFSKDKLIFEIR